MTCSLWSAGAVSRCSETCPEWCSPFCCSNGPKTRKSSDVSTIFAFRSPLQVDSSPVLINLCSVVRLLPVSRAASLIDTLAISYHPVIHSSSKTVYGKDAQHHRGVSHKDLPQHRVNLVKLLQQEQGLIPHQFSHTQRSLLLFSHEEAQCVSAQCKTGLFSASSLTQSLRSCRSAAASGRDSHVKA